MQRKKHTLLLLILLLFALPFIMGQSCMEKEKVGVIFVIHGGFENYHSQHLWDASVHMFGYDPNHMVYQMVVWNPDFWGMVLSAGNAPKEVGKYSFEYEVLGGKDMYMNISDQTLASLEQELNSSFTNYEFVFDYAAWMSPERIEHHPYPRYLYTPPADVVNGVTLTYCGESDADGPWEDCDPERYNVDGPIDRLLAEGVEKIVVMDWTMGGPRFFKTYDVVQFLKKALADNGASDIPFIWANDPNNLMERSYPTDPAGWTYDLEEPEVDPSIPLEGNANPVAEDEDVAMLHVEAIEEAMSDSVSDADTGILILNHATREWNQLFDPKIDDTLVINKNIKSLMLSRHPDIDPDNIIGAYMGVKELNPETGLVERTRQMRGENLGHAYLYEVLPHSLPGEEWGYLYWDALEYLKDRGVQHIVIDFTQIVANSVLNLVEQHNQIAKEIGYKTWTGWGTPDYETYPGNDGYPFAEYWGNWVDTDCGGEECCFEMGGCADGRPYPPPRQAPLTSKTDDLDPWLAYDVCEYGHLGYDPELGPPDPNAPVQDQYTGTWTYYDPPDNDPAVAKLLAKHVLQALEELE